MRDEQITRTALIEIGITPQAIKRAIRSGVIRHQYVLGREMYIDNISAMFLVDDIAADS